VAAAITHSHAMQLLRRPFAPGAIGFRAMTKVPMNGDPFAGAPVAAYLGAQSVLQRLNAVVPGRQVVEQSRLPDTSLPAQDKRPALPDPNRGDHPIQRGVLSASPPQARGPERERFPGRHPVRI
jgi:hypothetical protein